jgi:hypothetical protein
MSSMGTEYYSDWALGRGNIYVSGVNLGTDGHANTLYIFSTGDLSMMSISGLPAVTAAQTRSVAADAAGNAFIASQLDGTSEAASAIAKAISVPGDVIGDERVDEPV